MIEMLPVGAALLVILFFMAAMIDDAERRIDRLEDRLDEMATGKTSESA